SPERCHTAKLTGYEPAASGDASHHAYSSPAGRGGVMGGAAPRRSNNDAARGSAAAPNPRASRSASTSRPSTAAPHVTSAAAVPATVAIPSTAQRRGAGTSTPPSAGSHTKVYHSGQAPYGFHSHSPTSAATPAHAHAAGRTQGTRCGSAVPRPSAAAASTRATAP